MALVKCPDCGNEVSDQAPACPKCGRPAPFHTQPTPVTPKKKGMPLAGKLGLGCLGVIGLAATLFITLLVIGLMNAPKDGESTGKMTPERRAVIQRRIDARAKANAEAQKEIDDFLRERGHDPDKIKANKAEMVENIKNIEKWETEFKAEHEPRCDALPDEKRARDPNCIALECPGWLPDHYEDAAAEKIKIGWKECLVRAAWGEPDDVNKTITAYSTREQWVYGHQYVYFEDGRVTTIQD